MSLTDAEGDFVSYTVDVLSLERERRDGSSVEMLPAATRIDFAKLTDLSELVSAAAVVPAEFVGGTLRIDYSNAEIDVEAGGQIVKARPVDAQGQPLGVTELEIRLADRDHFVITRGRAALLSVDFNLAASNDVDTGVTPPTVQVQPFVT
ncbi:MAG TPA: metallophosphoesterase, partial [Gammaproteobacteria bacterium]|nr:metallophosphoesterase [Gammaproteobacteria bacterium]